jgi:olfactory receptor
MENLNLTSFTEFPMDISTSQELQVLQSLLFLVICLGALTGSLLTVTLIATDTHLHSPMYFLISSLSFIDLCSISVILSKSVMNSMTGSKTRSLAECAAQIFLYLLLATAEFAFLVLMSDNHYVAICYPLQYGLCIIPSVCDKAVGAHGCVV